MSLLVHDGRRNGHLLWCREALGSKRVDGIILNPFCTPWVARDRNPSVADAIAALRATRPDVMILVDPTTHGAVLPGTTLWDNYGSWGLLWPRGEISLDGPARIAEHVAAVFDMQQSLDVPLVAPTVELDRPNGAQAELALEIAHEARRLNRQCTQALVARRSFWTAGPDLDAFVGELAQLRATRWLVTPMRDQQGYPPDLTDYDATAGWLRTIHSLSLRSAVIAAHSDWVGVLAASAGANAVGTGWDQGQRICSPASFRGGGGGSYRLYSPHPGLLARFASEVAEAIQDVTPEFAYAMRGNNAIPSNETDHRAQHFESLGDLVHQIVESGPGARQRVPAMRHVLEGAEISWRHVLSLGILGVGNAEFGGWFANAKAGFDRYARAERL